MDSNDDYVMGKPFLVDSPELVSQLTRTRLGLWLGEWFVDTTDGTAYLTKVLAERYNKNPDAVIQQRILGTPGATAIVSFSSSVDSTIRKYTFNATVQTQFSKTPVPISGVLPL